MYTVSFFGHRFLDRFSPIEEKLVPYLQRWLEKEEYTEFLVGRDGDFDQLVTSAVLRTRRGKGNRNNRLIWVMPYPKAEYLQNPEDFESYYDEIEICAASEKTYPKAAIGVRNRAMVDRSDCCVFYVERPTGGAWQTLKYAEKQGKTVLNLAENR